MKGQQVPVTNAATLLVDGSSNSTPLYAMSALIKNPAGGVNVFLGGADVTTGTGYLLAANDIIALDLVNESLYAIVAAGSQTVYVLHRFT